MAAPHKCEGCFTSTTADAWLCDECAMEGRQAILAARAQGWNMAEQQQAYQNAIYARAQRVAERRVTHPNPDTQVAGAMFNPVPAGKAGQ